MYCNNCGKTLPEGSRFCNYCGSQTAGPAVGTLEKDADGIGASLVAGKEQVIFTLRPTMIFVLVRYIFAAVVVVAAAALMGVLCK
jgi:uncharacterized membrane protein YvbJ